MRDSDSPPSLNSPAPLTAPHVPIQGMVSCLAYAAEGTHLVAAGSYCGDVALYDSRTWEMLYLLKGHKGGVTQVWGKCGVLVRQARYSFCSGLRPCRSSQHQTIGAFPFNALPLAPYRAQVQFTSDGQSLSLPRPSLITLHQLTSNRQLPSFPYHLHRSSLHRTASSFSFPTPP